MTSKKHHYVPQFILRYFASSASRLIVARIDRKGSFPSSVKDLGHRNYGHSLYFPGRPTDHDSLEERMSDLEGAASEAVRRLESTARRVVTADDREVLAFFFALQWSRHRFLLDALRNTIDARYPAKDEDDDAYLRSVGLRQIIYNVLGPWEALKTDWSDLKDTYSSIASALLGMHWAVFRTRTDALVISDNMVCLSDVAEGATHGAPNRAWTLHGLGVGFANCRRVTVPLTPRLAVVMARNERDIRNLRAATINRFTVANSREFIAYQTDWPASSPRRYAEVAKYLFVQRFLMSDPLKLVKVDD